MNHVPGVFLSSTYFDLRQVRADLREFVETSLGYRLIASEFPSFPVDPSVDTMENCRLRVETDADVFVLVVGNRYGSVAAGQERSVTNIEYLTARNHGVPIFAFVHRDVLALLPMWEANPNADYSGVVDNPRLFQFIADFRSQDRVWSFAFDTAQEIVGTLRTQLAYQMQRGLELTRSLHGRRELIHLRKNALRIAAEKPKAWEALLLAELTEQGFRELAHLKRDHETSFRFPAGEHVSDIEFFNWVAQRAREAGRIGREFEVTSNDVLNRACQSGEVDAISYAAARFVALYREALEWTARVRSAHVSHIVEAPAALLAKQLDLVIQQLSEFPTRLRASVSAMLSSGGTHGRLSITLEIDQSLSAALNDALDRASDEVARQVGTA